MRRTLRARFCGGTTGSHLDGRAGDSSACLSIRHWRRPLTGPFSEILVKARLLVSAVLAAALATAAPYAPACAQVATNVPAVVAGAAPVIVETIKVHSQALEGNLEGETPDRDVI